MVSGRGSPSQKMSIPQQVNLLPHLLVKLRGVPCPAWRTLIYDGLYASSFFSMSYIDEHLSSSTASDYRIPTSSVFLVKVLHVSPVDLGGLSRTYIWSILTIYCRPSWVLYGSSSPIGRCPGITQHNSPGAWDRGID